MNENLSLEKLRSLCGEVITAFLGRGLINFRSTLRNDLAGIIQRVCEIQSSQMATIHRAIPVITSDWKAIKSKEDEKNKNCGHLFNPLELIPISETTHSRLLADLLNPKGNHGQGTILLETFLKRIGVPYHKDGEWFVSVEDGGVDICLRRTSPPSVVVIENKSNWAVDQPNQLYRYWYKNIFKSYPCLDYSLEETKKSFQILYLPPSAGKQPALHSLQRPNELVGLGMPETLNDYGVSITVLTFRDDITAWLDDCQNIVPRTNVRFCTHLQFYKEIWT